MKSKLARILLLFIAVAAYAQDAPPPNARLVSFPSHGETLYGYLYVPQGLGPFPAVLWNHGSEKRPGWQPELAGFYNSHGYVFFLPHRRGQGRSPGPYIMDEIRMGDPASAVRAQYSANEDVIAALNWLKAQPEVDPKKVVVSGCSFGGIQTLLTAEKDFGIRAFVAFAPGAMSWRNVALQQMLENAVKSAKAPVFILQAKNDFSTQPVEVLGKTVAARGGKAKIYPAFGRNAQDGHWSFATTTAGTAVWGDDVLQFIASEMR